jgi:hypothetical protein
LELLLLLLRRTQILACPRLVVMITGRGTRDEPPVLKLLERKVEFHSDDDEEEARRSWAPTSPVGVFCK